MMDYDEFKQRALGKQEQFKKTLKNLKRLRDNEVDGLFHSAHDRAFEEINCLDCALCCKHVGPMWTGQDIKRVAKAFKLKEKEFESEYLRIDEDGDYVFKSMPCPFLLEDNKCMIYDIRPKACREYPHTDRRKMKQLFKLTLKNSSHCPAVEKILDDLGKEI